MSVTPSEVPDGVEPPDPMRGALHRAADGAIEPDLRIEFRVSGGVEGQKYRLDFEASAAQGVVCVLECRLTGRRARTYDEQDGRGHLRQLSGALAQSGVLDEPPTTPRFLPDTLVGRITITAQGRSHVVYFAADQDQASVQDAVPSRPVAAAAAALYAAAAKVLNMENVAP